MGYTLSGTLAQQGCVLGTRQGILSIGMAEPDRTVGTSATTRTVTYLHKP